MSPQATGFESGSIAQRVYAVIAEFPGVKVSTAEIAAECELSSHSAGTHARNLYDRGLIKKSSPGRGGKCVFWVEP